MTEKTILDGAIGSGEHVIEVPSGDQLDKIKIPNELAVLPIRGTVTFPGTVMPLAVGRLSSLRLLEEELPKGKIIALSTQRDEDIENPGPDDLYEIGTAVMVLKLIRQPGEKTVSIIVHGLSRVKLKINRRRGRYYRAKVKTISEKLGSGKKFEASVSLLREQAHELIELSPNAPEEALTVLTNIDRPENLVDFLSANLNLDVIQKQDLLEESDVAKRMRSVHVYVSSQLEILKLQQEIQEDVQSSIGEGQRRFYLREQIKAIQKELGEGGDGSEQMVEELEAKLLDAGIPDEVMKEVERDLKRLYITPPASGEYSMIISYLELVAQLPWSKTSEDNLNLKRAKDILDKDHFGLDKVKRRLIEYLAVRKLNPEGKSPILCLIGPPGVGKTSLGQSIADALGRKFVRLSLGGIRDEAEIRGHRKTYMGAMPGRLIQELRRCGTNNPVVMLDEVDKLGSDIHGDPSSALLEVLDPRQNSAFVDRYLDVPFDLSQVIFIATANYAGSIPHALYDRMEVIEIAGYTDEDKLQIAKRYLVPRQMKENGLKRDRCTWKINGIKKVIHGYTREAGVRELERQVGSVCRGIAAEVAQLTKRSKKKWSVDNKVVEKYLGVEKYEYEMSRRTKLPGVVMGLAYTSVGGDILFIEATAYAGTGRVTLTGQLGDVMKESATAAMSLFKTRISDFGIDPALFNKIDIHIHVPAGAVPKDGPSAGCAMYTAIVSLVLDIPLKPLVAMTGEITLRGLVLPIGGLKEKTLAAERSGIKTVIIPIQNEKDLEEIDPIVRKKLKFIIAESVDDVLDAAIGKTRIAAAMKTAGERLESIAMKSNNVTDDKKGVL